MTGQSADQEAWGSGKFPDLAAAYARSYAFPDCFFGSPALQLRSFFVQRRLELFARGPSTGQMPGFQAFPPPASLGPSPWAPELSGLTRNNAHRSSEQLRVKAGAVSAPIRVTPRGLRAGGAIKPKWLCRCLDEEWRATCQREVAGMIDGQIDRFLPRRETDR